MLNLLLCHWFSLCVGVAIVMYVCVCGYSNVRICGCGYSDVCVDVTIVMYVWVWL